MSEHMFGLFRGHLTEQLVSAVEKKFESDRVSVVNYTEPCGEKRGWFTCRNRGNPFDDATASAVLEYARSIAIGNDAEHLGGKSRELPRLHMRVKCTAEAEAYMAPEDRGHEGVLFRVYDNLAVVSWDSGAVGTIPLAELEPVT